MPRYTKLVFCLFFLPAWAGAQNYTQLAKNMLIHLTAHRFDSVYAQFDETMQEEISQRQLAMTWMGIETQAEGFVRAGEPELEMVKEDAVATHQLCEFKKASISLLVVFDKSGKVMGMRLMPPRPKCDYSNPAYASDSTAYTEQPLALQNGDFKLPGILCTPRGNGPFPLVILVHGSGPNDKDETIGNYKLFKDLALGLATSGIATYRYEKRTKVYGKRSISDMDSLTVKEEVMDDVLQAIVMLEKNPVIDKNRIFLAGHSLGAMLAPRIAKQTSMLAGIIMLAGNARPLQDLVWDQLNYIAALDTVVSDEEKTALNDAHEKIERLKGDVMKFSADEMLLGLPPFYWEDLKHYNQVADARLIRLPILIMQGKRDYQVTMKDYELWQQALKKRKKTTFILYPDLNHIFMLSPEKGSPDDYSDTKGNLPLYVISDMAKWVKANKR